MTADVQALSEREKETLRLLLEGHDAKSIASNFGISVHTVNERLRTARRKLGVSSSREAARTLARFDQGAHNIVVDKEIGVVGDAQQGQEARRSKGLKGVKHPVILAIGGTLLMSLIIATAMLTSVASGIAEPGPLPNWSTATTTPKGATNPTNTVQLDGNRLLWNGVETSEARIREYLTITTRMTPQPVLILSYSAQTSPNRVHRVRMLIDEAILCKPGRCIEIAI
jgi:DNA-binding CsgD family transcriptional regulator